MTVEETLRKRPHRSKLWLSIYRPKEVFSAQVTGSFSFGDRTIDYYRQSGSYSSTYENITLLVGTRPGSGDIARVRAKSVTGTDVEVAENNIIWETGQNLTFIDYIDIAAVYPRIIKDPSDDDNVIFYKDWDIIYSGQNSVYGTFPNAGSHRAAFLETGSVSLFWSATGTYNVASQSLTYNWAFEGGTPTGSSAFEPGWVSYDTPGHYKTRLIVTAANGAIDTTYRYVSIYERPEEGSSNPIVKWSLNDISGSRSEGGYTASIRVWDELGDIEPNALVVIFADDWYGDEYASIGGAKNNSKIFMSGYILKETIKFNYKEGWAEFEIGSPTEVMKQAEGFSVSCESKQSPTTWFQLKNMTVSKAIYHYLRWHSTILSVSDFQYTGEDKLVQYFDVDRSSLYDAIHSFVSEGLLGEVVSDRQGKIWAEISETGYQNPFTSIQQTTEVQRNDRVGEPDISLRRTADVSFVEMGGIVYNGSLANTFQALLSNAPSTTPLYRGKTDGSKQGLILDSQSQLNQITGNYLADKNSPIDSVSLSLAGNYRNYDIAPQKRMFLLVDETDAPNTISLIGKHFKMTSMSWLYDAEKETLFPDVELKQVVTGTSAQTVIIPPAPLTGGYGYPPYGLPPLPGFPSPPAEEQLSTTVLMVEDDGGIVYTTDFDAVRPVWQLWNTGIPAVAVPHIKEAFIAPNGSVWVMVETYGGVFADSKKGVYYSPYLGGTFTQVIDVAWLLAEGFPASNLSSVKALGFNPQNDEEIAFVVGETFGVADSFYIGNSSGFVKKATVSGAGGGTPSKYGNSLKYGNDKWYYVRTATASTTVVVRFNSDGSSVEFVSPNFGQGGGQIIKPMDDDIVFLSRERVTQSGIIHMSSDMGNTWDILQTIPPFGSSSKNYADPLGRYWMGENNPAFGSRGKSYDGAWSWVSMPSLSPEGAFVYAYAGGEGTASKWIAGLGNVYYTDDFGGSWKDKNGNLRTEIFIPAINIIIIRAVVKNDSGEVVSS